MKGFFTYDSTETEPNGRIWHDATILRDFGGMKKGEKVDFVIMCVSPEGPVLRMYGREVVEVEFDVGDRRA